MCGVCYGEQINEKYSYKNFTNTVMTDADVNELNNTIIVGSCFYQENLPDRHIFPDNMTGVVFKRCNLDNVYIPSGNFVETEGANKSTHKKIKVQNDLDDWILDGTLKPKEPMNKEQRLKSGVSIDPKDIPDKKFTKEEKKQFQENLDVQEITAN